MYFTKFEEYDAAKEEPEGTKEMLIVNQQDAHASFDSGGAEEKVLQIVRTYDQPFELSKSLLITVVFEYEKNKYILGLDEPGFIFLEKPDIQFVSNTLKQQQKSFKSSIFVEDKQVKNKVCCSIAMMPDYHPTKRPFLVTRNRQCINLVNTRTMQLYPLIQDASATAWY